LAPPRSLGAITTSPASRSVIGGLHLTNHSNLPLSIVAKRPTPRHVIWPITITPISFTFSLSSVTTTIARICVRDLVMVGTHWGKRKRVGAVRLMVERRGGLHLARGPGLRGPCRAHRSPQRRYRKLIRSDACTATHSTTATHTSTTLAVGPPQPRAG